MSEHRDNTAPVAQPAAAPQQAQNEFRDDIIMMVDDEPLMLGVLEIYLQEQGYQHLIPLNDSTQAIDTILRERPDCVFLDLNMPEVDGFEILEKIRSTPEIQHLAAIVLTSDTDPETKLKALELGATDFLEKPIDSSELVLRLRNTLRAKAYQDQLTYYDGLTRLPNRTFFLERLDASIEHCKQRHSDLALMMVSIDRFQSVNDSLGPMAGDDVLKNIAGRLRKIINDGGADAHKSQDYGERILARMGGDEFAIALPGRMSKSDVVDMADEVRDAVRKPFEYRGKQVFLTASLGMARYPHDAGETGQLFKSAGAAKELAKKSGGNCLELYSKEITAKADARRSLEAELHQAIDGDQLTLYYQPQINVATGKMIGMEALVRWHHPTRGVVMPDTFIPLAEENDLILAIDGWVLQEACRKTRAMQSAGFRELNISVNVSARQFANPDLAWSVANACSQAGLAPRLLTLELTESLVMEDKESAAKMLRQLKDIGVTVSIDDFGTGYSALAYLKRFPIDELKIDRSFIVEIPENKDDAAIVQAVIAMARSLDLKVVAEGTETREQLEFLKANDCHAAQGHVIAQAMPEREFIAFAMTNLGPGKRDSIGTGRPPDRADAPQREPLPHREAISRPEATSLRPREEHKE